MVKILDGNTTESETFEVPLPFWVKVVGDLSTSIAQLQSRVKGEDEWSLEYTFSGDDKSVSLPGIDSNDLDFKVVTQITGIKAYWGRLQVSFPAR